MPQERRLAAILFTDLVGSTALMARSEEVGLRARPRHRELVRELVERHGGEFIEAKADDTLSIFGSVLDAATCALDIEAATHGEEFKLHLAIHSGDVLVGDGEVQGDGVNIAAGLVPLSEGGGIRISGEVYQAIRNHPEIEATLARVEALIEETGARCRLAPMEELRAELARAQGDNAGRARYLREAHRLYTEMGAVGHAERVWREP